MRPYGGCTMGCPVWRNFQGARAGRSHGRWAAAHPPLFGAGSNGGATTTGPFRGSFITRPAGLLVSSTQGAIQGSRALVPNQPSAAMESDVATKICLEGPVSDPGLARPGASQFAHAANARDSPTMAC